MNGRTLSLAEDERVEWEGWVPESATEPHLAFRARLPLRIA